MTVIVQSYFDTLLRYAVTFCGAVVLQVMDQKTLVKCRDQVSTEFDCRRISVTVHQSASDNLAVVHSSGAESYSGQGERKVSGKVSNINQRFVNSCLANFPSVYIYTVKRTL